MLMSFRLLFDGCERLLKVGDDVLDILDTDGQTDEVGGDAGFDKLLVGELAVGRVSGMQHASVRVRDMGRDDGDLELLHKGFSSLASTPDAKGDNAAGAVRQILLREVIILVAGQTAVTDPCDLFVGLQKFRDFLGI